MFSGKLSTSGATEKMAALRTVIIHAQIAGKLYGFYHRWKWRDLEGDLELQRRDGAELPVISWCR
jgi:hypothetical protein